MLTSIGYGDRIKSERQRLKLNQTQFAELANVSRASQAYYELENRVPDLNYLSALVGKVDVLFILTGEHGSLANPRKIEASLVEPILSAIDSWADESGRILTQTLRSELLALFLEQALEKGKIDTDWMGKMLKLVK